MIQLVVFGPIRCLVIEVLLYFQSEVAKYDSIVGLNVADYAEFDGKVKVCVFYWYVC